MISRGRWYAGLLAMALMMGPVNAASYRGYAKVIDVQPIEQTVIRPVTRHVCEQPDRALHLSQPVAATMTQDIRRQAAGWEAMSSCAHVADTETQTRITGYEVTYRYRGQVMTTRLSYHPGRRLAVNVDVVPLP